MIRKLRRRFIVIAMLSATVAMLLVAVSINTISFLSTNKALKDTLYVIHRNEGTMPQFPPAPMPDGPRGYRFTAEAPFSTRYFVLSCAEDGTLVSANMKHIAAVTEDDAEAYMQLALRHGEGFGLSGSYKYYVAKNEDGGMTAIFLDCHRELRAFADFLGISLAVIAVCLGLIFILVLFFSKRAITPIARNMEKQKQFITDAGHELKTPLTVINTSLKVLELETGESRWIGKIRTQTDKLASLVNNLVTLSRLDEEKPPLRLRDFDLSAATEEVAESFREFASERGYPLELSIERGLSYCGDESAIRQLLSILLDNAVRYSDGDGIIRLSLERAKKSIVLRQENPCSALEPSETERLFDRFYRADKARSNQTPGFGVGLSIAQSLVEAHQGTITALCPGDGTIRFLVRL